MLCLGVVGSTLIIMVLQPSWYATLAITPLLTVGVALPYVGDRPLKLLIVTAWMTTAAVTVLSELLSSSSPLPGWYDVVLRISSLLATAAVLLLILWQFRWRLMGTLIRSRAAEERYTLADRRANDGLCDWDLTSESIYPRPFRE